MLFQDKSSASSRVAALLLLFVTFIVYLPAMQGEFVCDDEAYIRDNPFLRTVEGLKHIWLQPTANPQYYPLTFTTFWVEFQLWGLSTTGYHIVNVLLHATNALLLWILLRQLAVPGAWLAAAIFALHPVHVESVAHIAERKNVLSGFFYLSALLCYVRYSPLANTALVVAERSWRYYILASLLFVCALLSKTVTCSLPAVILLLVWWKNERVRRKDIVPLVPLFILGLGVSLVTIVVEKDASEALGADWTLSFTERCLIAGRAVWFYIAKLLWPTNLALYPRWSIDTAAWQHYLFPLSATAALMLLGFYYKKVGKPITIAILFFVGTLVPALGFFDMYFMRYSFVADHFQYLASIGVIALVSGLLWNIRPTLPSSQLIQANLFFSQKMILPGELSRLLLSCGLLVILGFLAWQRSFAYRSHETLWTYTIQKTPTSWIAHNNLGVEFFSKGNYQQARPYFERALNLEPNLPEAHINLSLIFLSLGELDHAAEHGLAALKLKPNSSQFQSILGSIFWKKDEVLRAAEYFYAATQLRPTVPQAHYNLGLLYLQKSQFFPHVPLHHAISHFEKALELEPQSLQTVYTLVWTLATFPDPAIRNGERAVTLAQTACSSTDYGNPVLLDALAAAYAENGQFTNAITTAQAAVRLAQTQGKEQIRDQITERLRLYQVGQPYRENLTNIQRS